MPIAVTRKRCYNLEVKVDSPTIEGLRGRSECVMTWSFLVCLVASDFFMFRTIPKQLYTPVFVDFLL